MSVIRNIESVSFYLETAPGLALKVAKPFWERMGFISDKKGNYIYLCKESTGWRKEYV